MTDIYSDLIKGALTIAGTDVHLAEPTVARMNGINELFTEFDVWENNPSKNQGVTRTLLVRFDGDNEKVFQLCKLCCRDLPEGFNPDAVTGLELGALLQGFFIYYHLRAGTIALSRKRSPQEKAFRKSRNDTLPTLKKSSGASKNRYTGRSQPSKNTVSSAQTSPAGDSVPTKGS